MVDFQVRLETLIVAYQNATTSREKQEKYDLICKLYKPENYINYWFKKYKYLFNNNLEDFKSDYYVVFCNTLNDWKPRIERTENKFNGKGEFKNYFWSALRYYYINMIKSEATAKRNPPSKCPLCNKWVMPLSKHLLVDHGDLLWSKLLEMGIDVHSCTSCPFCVSYKIRPKDNNEHLQKHLMTSHTSFIFDKFKEDFPNISMYNKPASLYHLQQTQNQNQELNIIDSTSRENKMDILFSCKLSDTQKQIINHILSSNRFKKNIKYDKNNFNCTENDFLFAIDDLKEKMMMCGIMEADDERYE